VYHKIQGVINLR